MPEYTRRWVPGGLYFFTRVTAGRRPIFRDPAAVAMLGEAMRETRAVHPFEVIGCVVLHDHVHEIWRLPDGDDAYNLRISSVKRNFTQRWLAAGGEEVAPSDPQRGERRRGVWQPRYHEHTIRDDDDHARHLTYLHWNPVRHGLVSRPQDWAASTIHRYVREGKLQTGWGARPADVQDEPDGSIFGEP